MKALELKYYLESIDDNEELFINMGDKVEPLECIDMVGKKICLASETYDSNKYETTMNTLITHMKIKDK